MRILNVATSFPYPPDDGTKIQRFERIRELSIRHDVTLLCVSSEPVPAHAIREMERYCRCVLIYVPPFHPPRTKFGKMWQLARSIVHGAPYYMLDRTAAEAIEWLEREVDARNIDVVEADADSCIYLVAKVRAVKVAVVHNVHDVAVRRALAVPGSPMTRLNLRVYQILTRWHEARVFGGVNLCVALTRENCLELQLLYSNAHVRQCLSNGVDADYFSYEAPRQLPEGICFVGRMNYGPNVDAVLWFYREVFPLIRAKLPNFRFSIIGGDPSEAVRALARDPAVEVTGYVEDVRPPIRRCGIMVVPVRMGGGILNKLLQGLALGVPIVATPMALEGLSAEPDRDLLVAESPEELAEAVIRLGSDAALNAQLATSGRAYVEQHHKWSTMVQRYEAELEYLLRRRRLSDGAHGGAPTQVRTGSVSS